MPFVVRTAVPVMRSVRGRLREAAAVLGAAPFRTWREIDLPIVSRAALVGAGFAFAVSLGEFGATSFVSDPEGALRELLDQAPAGSEPRAVALFPCFMRGKNEYGRNDVEPEAVSKLLPGVPLFGMFCHGELGPGGSTGFETVGEPGQCRQHSMTTVVGVHAARG